jgi:hypothetical protein
LSAFLHDHGVGNDRTLFVTMANKVYVDPMVNFKWGLDIFHLGRDYLVLCLDQTCLEQAQRYDILAYDGFIEEGVNWHDHIARMKVSSSCLRLLHRRSFRFKVTEANPRSSKQTSTCLTADTTLSSWTATST